MNLLDLKNKKIAILGLGLENQALVRHIFKHKIKCEITVCDARKNAAAIYELPLQKNINWQLGKNFNKGLEKFDILFRSPGWPIDCPGIQKAMRVKSPLTPLPPERLFSRAGVKGSIVLSSPMKLFFDLCPSKNIIGVTGTKGKGTVASLIYEILRAAGRRVWLGGNIGVAPFAFIDKIKKNDWVVLELSSFQLEDMTVSPHIAVVTNFYPEHLKAADPNNPNYHKSLKDYWKAKTNIFKWQREKDKVIINTKFKILNSKQILNSKFKILKQIQNTIVYFKKSSLPSLLVGEHNKENIGAAAVVAKIAGVKEKIIRKAVANFKGLEHRLKLTREISGVKYYDDSFATTPEASIIALKSFSQPIILFLGGADKGANFKKLAKEARRRAKFVILLDGQATPRIKKELLAAGLEPEKMKLAYTIKTAVKEAAARAEKGEIVLLSTACASFGMFKNYKERGNLFKEEVKKLR